MAGIKETKDVLIAANEFSLFLVKRLSDGVGADDALALWDKIRNDDEFKKIFVEAYDNWQAIPGELVDIDVSEGFELAKEQLSYVSRFLAAIKG